MAQASQQELENLAQNDQPGAIDNAVDLAEYYKQQLEEKEKTIQELQQKVDTLSTTKGPDVQNKDNDDAKTVPKTDIILSIRGIPEFDQYPYHLESKRFYFMASLKAPYFRAEQRAPIDLIAVVDESGSMSGTPISLVRETVSFIIKNLEKNDRFGLVGYSNAARLLLPITTMDETGKNSALALCGSLRASGGTALCDGLVCATHMMRQRATKNDVASVMILTDGQANIGHTKAPDIINAVKTNSFNSAVQGPSDAAPMNIHARQRRVRPMNLTQGPPQQQSQMAPQPPVTPAKIPFDDEIPCTINTFGFGAGHNETLLEAIAENGRGMYAFIENASMIAETFAECLGGLVSVIGQDLKVGVEALNDVQINKIMSQGYKTTVAKPNKLYNIAIDDLQSEESRDLVFELTLPKISQPKNQDPVIQLSVQYKNVVKEKNETLTNICCVDRIDGDDHGERNIELDVQYNRVLAANAMDEADKLANTGKLDEARKLLEHAQSQINTSKSKDHKFSKNLVNDMQRVSDNMKNRQQFQHYGGKMLKMNKKAHAMQRSAHSSNYESQSAYRNVSKAAMISKFKK
jgi:hypothetical protein